MEQPVDSVSQTSQPHLPIVVSDHAEVRLRQRGYQAGDLEMILTYGSAQQEVTVLTAADARRAIEAKKREIQALERLQGSAVVMADGMVVASAYRPDRKCRRRHLGRNANGANRGRGSDRD